MITKSHEIHTRDDFALLCNWRRLYQGAVEVGVDRGEFAQCFLDRWYGCDYYGVDNYVQNEWFWDRTADLHVASIRFERHAVRARLAHGASADVARKLSHRKFDFIYIDGDHEYAGVRDDLAAWWPRVSDAGIFAGHDFDLTHPGVMQAVREFAAAGGLQVYLTHEPLPSWYIYRSGIPGADWKRLPEGFQL